MIAALPGGAATTTSDFGSVSICAESTVPASESANGISLCEVKTVLSRFAEAGIGLRSSPPALYAKGYEVDERARVAADLIPALVLGHEPPPAHANCGPREAAVTRPTAPGTA